MKEIQEAFEKRGGKPNPDSVDFATSVVPEGRAHDDDGWMAAYSFHGGWTARQPEVDALKAENKRLREVLQMVALVLTNEPCLNDLPRVKTGKATKNLWQYVEDALSEEERIHGPYGDMTKEELDEYRNTPRELR
jgi:hypothetical protein